MKTLLTILLLACAWPSFAQVSLPVATQAEVNTGTNNRKAVTPQTLAGAFGGSVGNVVTNVTPEQFGAYGNGMSNDTIALQSAFYAAEAGLGGGQVLLSSKTYNFTQLIITNPVTVLGKGSYGLQGSYTNASGTVVYATINVPTIPPYLSGTVLQCIATNSDAIVCSNLGVGTRWYGIGFKETTNNNNAFTAAGNLLAYRPPAMDTNYNNGPQDFTIQDCMFWGAGSNSYCISIYNELYGTVANCRCVGGGGIEIASLMDSPNQGFTYYPGNLLLSSDNIFMVQNGLAKGIYIHGHTNDFQGGQVNLVLLSRCQAATWNETSVYPWTTAIGAFNYSNPQSPIYVDPNTALEITSIDCSSENTGGGGPFIYPNNPALSCVWLSGDIFQQGAPLTNTWANAYNNNVTCPAFFGSGISFGKSSQSTKMQIRMLDWGDAQSGGPYFQGFQENGSALDTYMAPGNANFTWSSWTPSIVSGAVTLSGQTVQMSLNAANGNWSVAGTMTGNGVGVTNIQPFLIQTNFVLTKQYTNTYGCAITVSANVVTTTAAVAGDSSIALMAVSSPLVGGWTNTVGVGTTGSSLAVSFTNVLSIYVPTNSPYWFTNTSSGAGDTVSVLGGQIKYP